MTHRFSQQPPRRRTSISRTRLLAGYCGPRYLGCLTPWGSIVVINTLLWLGPGWRHWWCCEKVAGSWIVRMGPVLMTVWPAWARRTKR